LICIIYIIRHDRHEYDEVTLSKLSLQRTENVSFEASVQQTHFLPLPPCSPSLPHKSLVRTVDPSSFIKHNSTPHHDIPPAITTAATPTNIVQTVDDIPSDPVTAPAPAVLVELGVPLVSLAVALALELTLAAGVELSTSPASPDLSLPSSTFALNWLLSAVTTFPGGQYSHTR
jgi:hypothetical protein